MINNSHVLRFDVLDEKLNKISDVFWWTQHFFKQTLVRGKPRGCAVKKEIFNVTIRDRDLVFPFHTLCFHSPLKNYKNSSEK